MANAVCILGAFKINVSIANEPDVRSGWDICSPKRQVTGYEPAVSRGIVGTDDCTKIVSTKMGTSARKTSPRLLTIGGSMTWTQGVRSTPRAGEISDSHEFRSSDYRIDPLRAPCRQELRKLCAQTGGLAGGSHPLPWGDRTPKGC